VFRRKRKEPTRAGLPREWLEATLCLGAQEDEPNLDRRVLKALQVEWAGVAGGLDEVLLARSGLSPADVKRAIGRGLLPSDLPVVAIWIHESLGELPLGRQLGAYRRAGIRVADPDDRQLIRVAEPLANVLDVGLSEIVFLVRRGHDSKSIDRAVRSMRDAGINLMDGPLIEKYIKSPDLDDWERMGVTPREATLFISYGVGANVYREWRVLNVVSLEEVRAAERLWGGETEPSYVTAFSWMKRLSCTYEEAASWRRIVGDDRLAFLWKEAGFTPHDAQILIDGGLASHRAISWRTKGVLSPLDVVKHERRWNPDLLNEWTGFEPNRALEWYEAGFDPEGSRSWSVLGQSPGVCRILADTGRSPEECRDLSPYEDESLRRVLGDFESRVDDKSLVLMCMKVFTDGADELGAWQELFPLPTSELISWRRCLDDPTLARVAKELGLDPETAGEYVRVGLNSPELFRTEQPKWKSPSALGVWTESGFDPRSAAGWLDAGFALSDATKWRDTGADPSTAHQLDAVGISVELFALYRNLGMNDPTLVERFHVAGAHPEIISAIIESLMIPPSDLLEWWELLRDPDAILKWFAVSSDPICVREAVSLGLDLHDCSALVGEGVSLSLHIAFARQGVTGVDRVRIHALSWSVDELIHWMQQLGVEADEALDWRTLIPDSRECSDLIAEGVSNEEARRYRECGLGSSREIIEHFRYWPVHTLEEWRSELGFTAGDSLKWARVFDNSIEEALAWSRVSVDLGLVSLLRDTGVSTDEMARWMAIQVRPNDVLGERLSWMSIEEAETWSHLLGTDARRAREWKESGIQLDEVRDWIDIGFDAPEASKLASVGIAAFTARSWLELGVGSADAILVESARWTPADASLWSEALVCAVDEAHVWFESFPGIVEALAWHRRSFDSHEATQWVEKEFSLEEATEWRRAEFGPLIAIEWRTSGFLPSDAIEWAKVVSDSVLARECVNKGIEIERMRILRDERVLSGNLTSSDLWTWSVISDGRYGVSGEGLVIDLVSGRLSDALAQVRDAIADCRRNGVTELVVHHGDSYLNENLVKVMPNPKIIRGAGHAAILRLQTSGLHDEEIAGVERRRVDQSTIRLKVDRRRPVFFEGMAP